MAGINRTIAVLALAVWGLALVGCGSSKAYHGKWRGELPGKSDESLVEKALRRVDVTIESDATFEANISTFPYTGTYRLGDGKLLLDVKKIVGKPVESYGDEAMKKNLPFEMKLNDDGTVTLTDPAGYFSPVVLQRVQP